MDPDGNSTSNTNEKIKEIFTSFNSMLDARTLLQVNATIIVGILFLIALTSVGFTNLDLALFTFIVVIPFAISAVLIILADILARTAIEKSRMIHEKSGQSEVGNNFHWLSKSSKRMLEISREATIIGFTILVFIVFTFLYFSWPGSIEEQCAANFTTYNVTHPWQCASFGVDTLAGQCASDPNRFHLELSECSKFIPPSGDEVLTAPPL